MSVARGDIVLVDFPMTDGSRKRRPALVVQSNHNNVRLTNSIFAMITSNTRLSAVEATQVLIDVTTTAGLQSRLRQTSAVKCENLYTLSAANVRKLGSLPADTMLEVNAALMKSLELV